MGLLNNCNILPVDPHVGHREPYEKNKGVFKKHALSLAEGARPVLRPLEGKAAATWTGERTREYGEHGQGVRTPLACLPSLLRRSSFGYEGRELQRRHGGIFQHSRNVSCVWGELSGSSGC
jgi:hypothetical protein